MNAASHATSLPTGPAKYLWECRIQSQALWRYLRQRSRHELPVCRYERIDPTSVEYLLSPYLKHHYPLTPLVSAVLDGEWDQAPVRSGSWIEEPETRPALCKLPLSSYQLYESMAAHFNDGVPWESTDWIEAIRQRDGLTNAGGVYADVETALAYLAEIDTLYEQITTDGFRAQRELKNHPFAYLHEVTVTVGRDGSYYASRVGRHRLGIAQLLGLESIPVRVWVQHAEYDES